MERHFFLMILIFLNNCLAEGKEKNRCKWKPENARSHKGVAISFASYYANSMVLQRAPASPVVWGYASETGLQVDVKLNHVVYSVISVEGPNGNAIWRAVLDPQTDPGPVVIEARTGDCTITLTDVLFGDVWICAGQSNMRHRLDNIDDPEQDVADAVNYPNVRSFMMSEVTSETPQYDLISIGRNWVVPNSTNMASLSAICWLFGRDLNIEFDIPIGLIQTTWDATRIEAWSSPDVIESCYPSGPPFDILERNSVSGLWNAMVHPFLQLTIKGAIWYQGERNRPNYWDYPCAISHMVADWRNKWFTATDGNMDSQFPFGQVQLAPNTDDDISLVYSYTRWAQTSNLGYTPNPQLPRVFTAISIDLPDFESPYVAIHPRYKRQIAKRLTYGAYQLAYNIFSKGPYQGPMPTSVKVKGKRVEVIYDRGDANIEIRDHDNFELCCADTKSNRCPDNGVWTLTTITGNTASSVTLDNPCSNSVTGMRYAWRESPCALELCAVYGVDNSLPAPPWIMDV